MKKAILVLVLAVAVAGCGKPGKIYPTKVDPSEWHELQIGEILDLTERTDIRRVPGGWIWTINGPYTSTGVFIPYSEEGKMK